MEGGIDEEEICATPDRKSACEDKGSEFKKTGQSEHYWRTVIRINDGQIERNYTV
jgi:hypothetical protein